WLGARAVADLVAELDQQGAGDRLELRAVGAVHALAPAADALRVRLLGRPLAVVGQLALHLLEPVGGALVVVEESVVPGELEELTDPLEGRAGVEDQVLVADLLVVGEVPCLLAGAGDPPHPALGDPADRMLLDGPVTDREGDVATVADDVDEARLRQRPLDLPHALDVDRGLLTPAGLAGPLGI